MKPEKRDRAYLWDMREFARNSRRIVQRISFARLEKDFTRRLALERSLELLGEAARRVSEAAKGKHAGVDWRGRSVPRDRPAARHAGNVASPAACGT